MKLRHYLLPFSILLTHALHAVSPVADAGDDITIADYDGNESVTVVLDASATTDADGDIISYEWTWAGGSASGEVTEGTFPATDSPVTVTLTVTDADTNVAIDTLDVTAYKQETALFTDFNFKGFIEGDTFAAGLTAYRFESGNWVPSPMPSFTSVAEMVDPDTILSTIRTDSFKVIRYDGSAWNAFDGTLDVAPPTGSPFDRFQRAYSTDHVVIANEYNNDNGNDFSGKIFVYDWVGDDWVFSQELINPNFPSGFYERAFAGRSVDIDGDVITVTRNTEIDSDLVYDIYRKVAGNWVFETTLEIASPGRFAWVDADVEGDVILAQRATPSLAMVVYEYDAIAGWEPTFIPINESLQSQFFGYRMNEDGNSFVAYDESGKFIFFEKDDPAQAWADTTVSERRLLTKDLNTNRDVDVTDISNGKVVIYDANFGVSRLIDTVNDVHPINVEPIADAGFDISATSFDGDPIRTFFNGGATVDLNYGESLEALWEWNGGSASGLQTFANLPADVSQVTLTVTDSQGGISRDSISVAIERPPVITELEDVIAVDTDSDGLILVKVEPITDRPDSEIASWNWRWPGGTFSGKSGVIALEATADGEVITLEVVDVNGLASEVEFKFNLLEENPEPDILLAADGGSNDEYGADVAIDDGFALIGAPAKEVEGETVGATYLAEILNDQWQQQSLDPGSLQGTAVAIDEEYAFVGVDQALPGSFTRNGGVRVYQRDALGWTFSELIEHVDGDGSFGASLARDGDYLVVGAPETSLVVREGAAHIYKRQLDGTWDLEQSLRPETPPNFENFGERVAIHGNYLALTSGANSGRLYIYERGATEWELVTTFENPRPDRNGYGLYSLAMNESEILVGARGDDEFTESLGNGAGAVYRYTLDPSLGWQANGKLYPRSYEGFTTRFGESLALDGDILLVGAPTEDSRGAIVIFQFIDDEWSYVKTQNLLVEGTPGESDSLFGISVDHDGRDMIVGATRGNNSNNVQTGKAYIYRNYAALNPNANYEPEADAGADINVSDTIVREEIEPFVITEPLGSEPVVLDASASIDEENDIVSYEWSWPSGSATGLSPTARFPVGTTTVTLTVTDGFGIVNSDTVDVTVSLAQADPVALPDVSGNSLTVDLPVSGALWRLSSEFLWHADGATVNNVEADKTYQIEIIGFPGSTETISTFITTDSAIGNTLSTLNVTLPIQPTQTGTLRFPETEQGFSWRLAGESTWRNVTDNGDTVEDVLSFSVPRGPLRVEFKPVLGYATPQTRIIDVGALSILLNWGEYIRINNFDSSKTFDLADLSSDPNLETPPYQYIGKIRTPLGRGSGTAVADGVVLTAAHLFFDFNGLQWSDVQWFPRQLQGTFQAAPVLPRGILYRTSYAKLVAPDSVEGEVANLPEDDQEVDFAVLYFGTSWEGGSANFLQSTAEKNWITGAESKHALGYPQRSQSYPDKGKIFEKLFGSAMTPLDSGSLPLLYETGEVFGDGGASGSALFVQPEGSSQFYPAAVLLAGQGRGVYHIIDSDVTRMIKDGQDAASGNDDVLDNNSSLVTYESLGGITAIGVDISPGGVLSNARWSVTPNAGTGFANLLPAQAVPINPAWDSFTVSFTAVSGYATPDPVFLLPSDLTPGVTNGAPAVYEPLSGFDDWLQANAISDPLDDSDGDQRSALLEYATDGEPTVVDFLDVVRVLPTPAGNRAQYEIYVSAEADAILYEVKAVSSLTDVSDPAKVELLATFTRSDGPGYQTVTDTKTFFEASSRFVWLEITHDRNLATE